MKIGQTYIFAYQRDTHLYTIEMAKFNGVDFYYRDTVFEISKCSQIVLANI